jgi:VanZ family protein
LLAWIAFIIGTLRPGTPLFKWVGRQPWGDKITHILIIGMLAFLFNYALAGRRIRLGFWSMPLAILVTYLFMTCEEISQIWIPGRNFEWVDLTANYIGITVAWLASMWLIRRP